MLKKRRGWLSLYQKERAKEEGTLKGEEKSSSGKGPYNIQAGISDTKSKGDYADSRVKGGKKGSYAQEETFGRGGRAYISKYWKWWWKRKTAQHWKELVTGFAFLSWRGGGKRGPGLEMAGGGVVCLEKRGQPERRGALWAIKGIKMLKSVIMIKIIVWRHLPARVGGGEFECFFKTWLGVD